MGSFRSSLLVFGLVMAAGTQPRSRETILPALSSGGGCWSAVELQNLGETPVTVEIEAHREGGGLVPFTGRNGMAIRLGAGERGQYRLQIPEETANAWVKVREPIALPDRGPAVAISGVSECVAAGQLISTVREAVYPLRNPWFEGGVSEFKGGVVFLTNTSEQSVTVSFCYSSGGLFSVPDGEHPASELRSICSAAFEVQIPPLAARQFPVEREGNSQFALRVRGSAVALLMLRQLKAGVKVYTVDSTIRFGGEVSGAGARQ